MVSVPTSTEGNVMLKFIIIVIAALVFGYYAYINFDDAFGDNAAAVIESI